MIGWLFTFLVVYLLYKLIFDFILPVSKASSQMHSKIKEMHQQQEDLSKQKSAQTSHPRPSTEDYIDFEEIKEPRS
jgi:hypothetical protein